MDEFVFQSYIPLTEFTATVLSRCQGLTVKRLMPMTRSGQAERTRLSVKGSYVFFIMETKFYVTGDKGFLRVYLRYPDSMSETDATGKMVNKVVTLFKQDDISLNLKWEGAKLQSVLSDILMDPRVVSQVTKKLNSCIVKATGGAASALTRESSAVLSYAGSLKAVNS